MSLNDSDFGSDTDDDDYVPTGEGHDASEEENSGEEEPPESGSKTGPKKRKPNVIAGRPSMFDDDGEQVNWKKELADEKKELEEVKEKKKVDDLWADFKKDTSKSVTHGVKKSTVQSSNSLFEVKTAASASSKILPEKKSSNHRFASLFDNLEKSSDKETPSAQPKKPKNRFGGLFDEPEEPTKSEEADNEVKKSEIMSDNKVEITKVYDFAGEVVKVNKQVDADSSEAKKFLKSQEEGPSSVPIKRPGGLAGVVGSIGKKAKLGCLDKSKLDWNSFVQETGIKEELQTFNKGKDGYVEKQMFLERTDLRQFEMEKAVRDKNRKSLMK